MWVTLNSFYLSRNVIFRPHIVPSRFRNMLTLAFIFLVWNLATEMNVLFVIVLDFIKHILYILRLKFPSTFNGSACINMNCFWRENKMMKDPYIVMKLNKRLWIRISNCTRKMCIKLINLKVNFIRKVIQLQAKTLVVICLNIKHIWQ